jgi:hypothetical protein
MAQYLLLLHADPTGWINMPPQEQQKWMGKYKAWGDQAQKAGYLLGSNKLVDHGGKIVRGPKALVTDGPFSETKEVLGGYYLIEAKDYDEAVRRCKGHPHLEHGGTIEVRQIEQLPR